MAEGIIIGLFMAMVTILLVVIVTNEERLNKKINKLAKKIDEMGCEYENGADDEPDIL